MGLYPLSRAPRTCFSLDQTTKDLPRAWNDHRSDQKQGRTAGGKRVVAATTDHLTSTGETTHLPKERSIAPGATGQNGSDLETEPLHYAARDASELAL